MADSIFLTNVRLSFPKLVEAVAPSTPPGAAKKFGCDLILPANHPDLPKFMEEVGKVASAKWKEQAAAVLGMLNNDRLKRCWGQGSEKLKKDTMKPYEGYEGMFYISASSNEDRPPVMILPNGDAADPSNSMLYKELARKLYGGCYVNAAISLWVQDNQFGRGVRCNLQAIQFAKDGDPFGDAIPDFSGKFGAVQQPAAPAVPAGFPAMPWMQ